jgi:hypothetical protein
VTKLPAPYASPPARRLAGRVRPGHHPAMADNDAAAWPPIPCRATLGYPILFLCHHHRAAAITQ